jgi:hypothetical protein
MRPRGAAPGTHRRLLLRRIVGVKAEMLRTAPIRRSWTIAGKERTERIVDGRECWYPGRPGKPKDELFWHRGNAVLAEQTMDQPETETETQTEPSEPPSRLEAAPPQKPEVTEELREEWRPTAAEGPAQPAGRFARWGKQ